MILETMRKFHGEYGYHLDPHSAASVFAGVEKRDLGTQVICLCTAHPAKFADLCERVTGVRPNIPRFLRFSQDTKTRLLDLDVQPQELTKALKKVIVEKYSLKKSKL